MNKQEEFTVKRIDQSNLKDLVYLMSLEHKNHNNLEYFVNKFKSSCTGKAIIAHVAYDKNGEPASFLAAYPLLFSDGKNIFLAGQLGDGITNSKFQRCGLFIKLATITQNVAREEGMKLLYGFPNQNSAPTFFNKLEWGHFGRFTVFQKSTYKNLNIYNFLNKFGFLKPGYKIYFSIVHFVYKTSVFENSNDDLNSYSVYRNDDFFEYKKYEKSYFFKIDNFKFWFKFGDGIIIGDVEKFDIKLKDSFHKSLKKLANILGVKKITIQAMPDTFLFLIFKRIFDDRESIEIGAIFLDENLERKKLKFSEGDSDTF